MRIPCKYDKSGSGDLFSWDNPEEYIRDGYYHGAFPLKTDPRHRGDVVTLLIEAKDGSFIQLQPRAVRICEKEGAANVAEGIRRLPSEEMYKPQPTQTEINMVNRFSSKFEHRV